MINICTDEYNGKLDFSEYSFNLSNFQKHSIDALEKGNNVEVVAPTACGKTLVAEHIIKKAANLDKSINKRKIIYTSPIKALSNCLFNEFSKKFKNINFGLLTGDIKYNPDADCIIMTTEILRNLLYNKKIKSTKLELSIEIDIYQEVYAVIFDEVHYIANKERGRVWEESLILLPSDIQLIMLSATIDKPEIFGKWIQDIKNVPLTLSSTNKRVVPLKHYIYLSFLPKFDNLEKKPDDEDTIKIFNKNLIEIMDEHGSFNIEQYEKAIKIKNKYSNFISKKVIFNDLGTYLKERNMLPAIMFTLSRKKCEEYSKMVNLTFNDDTESCLASKIFDNELRKSNNYNNIIKMPEYIEIKELITKGIAYHHSGIYHLFKEVIEKMLSYKDIDGTNKPLIKFLFATETFAVGVNVPVKVSCYTGLTKFSEGDFRYLKSYEFKQMSGRAGRRGMDPIGIAILIPNLYDLPKSEDMKNIMNGENQKIISRFTPNFQFLLKIILTGNKQIMQFIQKSLLNDEINKEIKGIENRINEIKLPNEDFKICIEYDKLINPNKDEIIKVSQKMIKKYKKEANILENKPGFRELYSKYLQYKSVINENNNLNNDLYYTTQYIHNSIIKILQFLKDNNYIDNHIDIYDYENISPQDITTKGIINSQINECNGIIFTEAIINGYFDNLTPQELVSVLAIFISTKIEDTENPSNLHSTNLPYSIINTVDNIEKLKNKFLDNITYNQIDNDLDWEIYLNMVEPVYLWSNGKEFNEIILEYNLYSGNFVKDIIKINNIVQDVTKMAKLLDKTQLVSIASQIENKIIRDNVNTESLYIN